LDKEVTPKRVALFKKSEEASSEEVKMRLLADAKKYLAVEKLVLALALTMCVPEDLSLASEAVEQIDDLLQCLKDLGLGEKIGSKQAKTGKTKEDKEKALNVLFDTLVAQLLKSQNFVREMANYVFSHFCSDLDGASLDHMLSIVSQSNEVTAAELLEEDGDDESGEDESMADDSYASQDDDSD